MDTSCSAFAIGCDVVSVERLGAVLARNPPGFRDDLFSPDEQARAGRDALPLIALACSFALKESVMKALGYGIGHGLTPRMIDTAGPDAGATLSGLAARCLAGRALHLHAEAHDGWVRAVCVITPREWAAAIPRCEGDWDVDERSAARASARGASIARMQALCRRPAGALRQAFAPAEQEAQLMRRHPEPGLQARLLVKRAARRLLRRAGYRAALPSAGMLLAAEPSGRPRLELSPEAAAWLEQREFAVSVSLAHAGAQVMGVALIGRNIL